MSAQLIVFPIERVVIRGPAARPEIGEPGRVRLDKLLDELKAARSEKKELERRIRFLTMRARQALERIKRERLAESR